jgi:hypothetical protein
MLDNAVKQGAKSAPQHVRLREPPHDARQAMAPVLAMHGWLSPRARLACGPLAAVGQGLCTMQGGASTRA